MKYCHYCKKPMYTSNCSIWIDQKNYPAHQKCIEFKGDDQQCNDQKNNELEKLEQEWEKKYQKLKLELSLAENKLRDFKDTVLNWCWKNNTIPMPENPTLHLCTTDGGWVNVLKFQTFLNEMLAKTI